MPRRSRRTKKPYAPTRGRFAGHTFRTRWEYRKALARAKERAGRGKAEKPIRTRKDLEALSVAERDKRDDALEVLNLMRKEGLSFRAALRRYRAETPTSALGQRSALKYIRPALRKMRAKWAPKSYDRLLRIMDFPTRKGVAPLEIRDSRTASQIGKYWNAVQHYLQTGETDALRPFRGTAIRVGKVSYPFVTHPRSLDRLQEGAELERDSIYERWGIAP